MNSPITDERLKEILGIFETIGSKPGFSAESELASIASELLAAREALKAARWYVEAYDTVGMNTEQARVLELFDSALSGKRSGK